MGAVEKKSCKPTRKGKMKRDNLTTEVSNESLWKMIMTTHTDIAKLISDYQNIKDRINAIDNKVTILVDHEYRIKYTEKSYQEISNKVDDIEEKTSKIDERFILIDDQNQRKSNFWKYIANNWHKIAIIGGALAAIIDFVYKIDPK